MPRFKNGLSRVGKYYHYCFRIDGTQHKGSTRATDRTTAEEVLANLRREALLGPQSMPTPIPTLKHLITSWLSSYRTTYSARHIELVESSATVWILPALGDRLVNQISTQDVLDLRSAMLEKGRSPATANLMLRNLKLLMSYAVRLGHLGTLPFKVAPLRFQRKPRPTVPASRVHEFIDHLDGATRDLQKRAALRVMIGLGMRASEIAGMRWEWMNIDHQTYQIGKAKGKEARILPIPNWVWTSLVALPKTSSPWVFPNKDNGSHNRNWLRLTLQKVVSEMGMDISLSHHRLRASFATLHSDAGTPITEIKGMLGHKNIATTLLYVETSLDAKRKFQDNLSQKLGLS